MRHELAPAQSAVRWLEPLSDTPVRFGTHAWSTAAARFHEVLQSVSPDLVHAGPVPTAGFFAAGSGFHPLLVMSWGSDVLSFPDEGREQRRIAEFALRCADMAIADCEVACARIAELGGLRRNQIVSLPWGVDLKRFLPKTPALGLRRRLGWSGCRVVISTRALEPVHRPLFLLEAMARVMKERDDVRLLMLGDGSMKEGIASFVETANLCDKTHLAGQVAEDALPDYFAEADLYVSATGCDGSSVSLLQAMACGLPVAVADGYGNKEWVKHGENGWLYPVGDINALAHVILEGLDDTAAKERAVKLNVQVTQARSDWDKNFVRVIAAYDELLTRRCTAEVMNYAQLQNR